MTLTASEWHRLIFFCRRPSTLLTSKVEFDSRYFKRGFLLSNERTGKEPMHCLELELPNLDIDHVAID